MIAGIIWIFAPVHSGDLWADVAIHVLAIGFAMSMVIAHVSIIVPSIVRRGLPYSPVLYIPLVLLNLGVAVRAVGAVLNRTVVWQAGDAISIAAMAALMLCILTQAVRGVVKRRGRAHTAHSKPIRSVAHNRIGRRHEATASYGHAFASVIVVTAVVSLFMVVSIARPDVFERAQSVQSSGQTTTHTVVAHHMAFNMSELKVPAGNNLVVKFTNNDDQNHDLVFSNGVSSGRVAPGKTVSVQVGAVRDNIEGWCSIAGHKAMGMQLKNETTMQHNVDFHAGLDGNPNELMGLINPCESHSYTFTAQRSGIWLYHCSTSPMSLHMASGMIGAVIIEPREGLPHVDHEYVLVQSEMYLGSNGGAANSDKIAAVQPDIVQFNGRVYQYDAHPLQVKTGQSARFWLLNAGPNLDLDFHIVGAQFSTVWSEGRYLVNNTEGVGSQTVDVATASGAFVETTFTYPGTYIFLNHKASYAEKGAMGAIEVSE
ncbi:multicopper oxidase domain-containing protein [Alloscardovia sp. HMSC034E08]|uniref:multicopper oxidase domain-containing protein n=1 Tax=Alloscardovia sp. HMSC034E08 TaxID=1739413 RepID=UPI0008ADB69B|nr:multicopper oxidase domain-containing protein [Alloscardovia sp. HMSC034E08]OFQ99339.1 hypothetical protein HMPREF2909_07200 [Alloscardovia sp. HMSC034E08]